MPQIVQPGGDGFGRAGIGGQRDLMDVADAHEGAHVGLVRLGGERIAKEDDGANLAEGDAGADDQVAAVGAVGDAFDASAGALRDQSAGAARGDERESLEHVAMAQHEFDRARPFSGRGR